MSDYVSIVVNMKALPASIGNLLMSIISKHKKEEEERRERGQKTNSAATTTLILSKNVEEDERKIISGSSPMLMFLAALLFSGGMGISSDRRYLSSSATSEIVLHKSRRLGETSKYWSYETQFEASPIKIEEEERDDGDEGDEEEEEDTEKTLLGTQSEFEASFLEALGGKMDVDADLLKWMERLQKLDLSVGESQMDAHDDLALTTIYAEEESEIIRISIPRHVLVQAQRSNNKLRDVLVSSESLLEFGGVKSSLRLLNEANRAIVDSVPVSSECTCGVYRLVDSHGPVAIWKPEDEENSNKKTRGGEESKPLREGLKAGDGAVREVAAFALDQGSGGRAGVPVTLLTSMEGRRGSLQRFESHKCCADDIGTMLFENANVHSIGILDLRLFNLDRHGGNILVDETNRLIPIDHGLSLPPIDFLGEAEFGWINWRQAKVPFSSETLDYLRALSPANDAKILGQIGIPKESISTNYVCTSVVKHFALNKSMSLYDIASLFCRKSAQDAGADDRLSVLERAVSRARGTAALTDDELSRRTIEAMEDILVEDSTIPWTLGMSTVSLWRRHAPSSSLLDRKE